MMRVLYSPFAAGRTPRRLPPRGPDRIGLCGFHDAGFALAAPAEAHDAHLQLVVRQLHTRLGGCSTNLVGGLRAALAILRPFPRGVLRRVWLLTDGYPNRDAGQELTAAHEAREAWVNVNTVGFGDRFDEALLRRISAATHNGKFLSVRTLRQLSDALTAGSPHAGGRSRCHHRTEITVLAIDLSGSMLEPMGGSRKIDVVQEAILHLLRYKQQCFS